MLALTTRAWRRGSYTPAAFAKRALDLGANGLVLDRAVRPGSPEAATFVAAGAALRAAELPGGLTTLDRELLAHRLREHLEVLERAAEAEIPLLFVEPGEIDAALAEEAPGPGEERVVRRALEARAQAVGPHLDALRHSLEKLVRRADSLGRRIAVVNPPDLQGLPSFQEMERLAADFSGGPFGLVLDSGAAWAIEGLGLKKASAWMSRFAPILSAVRLHDARREKGPLELHLVPGEGEVDFPAFAKALSESGATERPCFLDMDASRDEGRLPDAIDLLRRSGLT